MVRLDFQEKLVVPLQDWQNASSTYYAIIKNTAVSQLESSEIYSPRKLQCQKIAELEIQINSVSPCRPYDIRE